MLLGSRLPSWMGHFGTTETATPSLVSSSFRGICEAYEAYEDYEAP